MNKKLTNFGSIFISISTFKPQLSAGDAYVIVREKVAKENGWRKRKKNRQKKEKTRGRKTFCGRFFRGADRRSISRRRRRPRIDSRGCSIGKAAAAAAAAAAAQHPIPSPCDWKFESSQPPTNGETGSFSRSLSSS